MHINDVINKINATYQGRDWNQQCQRLVAAFPCPHLAHNFGKTRHSSVPLNNFPTPLRSA